MARFRIVYPPAIDSANLPYDQFATPEFVERFSHLMSQSPVTCCCGMDACLRCMCCRRRKEMADGTDETF
jgi:hypothetical protein